MSLPRRIAVVLLGLILALFGVLFFMMMCGSNAHVAGALLGGLGGAILGLRRHAARVLWYATFGSLALAVLGAGMEYLSAGSCAGPFNALGSGAFTGFGLGLVVDGVRSPSKPKAV
jgi:hypothetical protein